MLGPTWLQLFSPSPAPQPKSLYSTTFLHLWIFSLFISNLFYSLLVRTRYNDWLGSLSLKQDECEEREEPDGLDDLDYLDVLDDIDDLDDLDDLNDLNDLDNIDDLDELNSLDELEELQSDWIFHLFKYV